LKRSILDSNTNNNADYDDDDGDTKKYSKKRRRERKKKGAHGEELYKFIIVVDFEIFLSTRTVTQITEAIRSITELLHYYNYY